MIKPRRLNWSIDRPATVRVGGRMRAGAAAGLWSCAARWLVAGLLIAAARGAAGAEVALPQVPAGLETVFAGQAPSGIEQLQAMQQHITKLARAVTRCTVSVQFGAAHGSGVIVSEDGYVLTVAHVVGVPGRQVRVRLADGQFVWAQSLGMHRALDAGLVKLMGDGPWPYLPMNREGQLRRGQWCAAAGHPGGHDMRRGPVFRVGRILSVGELIRTDCQLVGGDSGGPLVDMQGQVIGIHSRIGVSLVNNLHVPAATFATHWDDLLAGKLWESQAFIGVRGDPAADLPRVVHVHEASPAALAGVKSGDIVRQFAGEPIATFTELIKQVQSHQPGETLPLVVLRGEEELKLEVTLGRRD